MSCFALSSVSSGAQTKEVTAAQAMVISSDLFLAILIYTNDARY